MKDLGEIFKSQEYKTISEYLKKADRWDLTDKLIDLASISYNAGYDSAYEIYKSLLKII